MVLQWWLEGVGRASTQVVFGDCLANLANCNKDKLSGSGIAVDSRGEAMGKFT
jgi:hypothetical protein